MGVSFQIIPMFYVTPDYPKWVSHFLPVAIILQLIIFSISRIMIPFGETSILIQVQLVLLTLCVSSYAIYTLFLIGKRKRKTLDITLWFWKTAMGSLIIAAAVFLVMLFQPGQYQAQLELIIGETPTPLAAQANETIKLTTTGFLTESVIALERIFKGLPASCLANSVMNEVIGNKVAI